MMIRPAEWRWATGVALGVMGATVLPYLWAGLLAPPGHQYVWLLYNPDDQNVHLAWVRQAADGQWLLHDPYTTETQQAQFFNVFMVGLGKAVRLTGLPPVFLYHAVRVAGGVALFVALYWFAALLSPKVVVRRLTVLLAAGSSGLGWAAGWFNALLTPLGLPALSPPDFGTGLCMPEAITFLSVYLFPLFTVSLLLLVVAFGCFLLAERTGRGRYVAASAASALVLGNLHTYDLFPLCLALLLWSLQQVVPSPRRALVSALRGLTVVLGSAPAVLYQVWVYQSNTVFQLKANTKTLIPSVQDMVAAYGLLVPLAAAGAVLMWRSRRPGARLAVCWVAAVAVCLGLPVSFQRKMAEGLHLPLCFLAAVALGQWLPVVLNRRVHQRRRPPRQRLLHAATLLALVPSNVAFVGMTMRLAVYNNRGLNEHDLTRYQVCQPPYYLPDSEWAAIRWLDENTSNTDVVLCAPFVGNHLPALSGNQVYVGHWAETLNFGAKLRQAIEFYTGRLPPETARALLTNNRIRYVYVGVHERNLGAPHPLPYDFLQAVHAAPDGTVVYRVRAE